MSDDSRRSVLGILFLTVFVDIVGFSIIFPLFPSMLKYYFEREGSSGILGKLIEFLNAAAGAEGEEARLYTQALFGGVLGSLYSFLQFASASLWGRLSDRAGRKPILIVTIGGLALSYVLWFFSGTFFLLVLSRLLGGVMSGNIAVATAAVADTTSEKNRARGMGVIGAAIGLGMIFGPAIGGSLSYLDLSRPLHFLPGVNLFSAAAAGAFLLSAANLYSVSRVFRETLSADERGEAQRTQRPISPAQLFRRVDIPGVNRINAVYFIFLVAFAGMEFTLTFLARDRFDYTRGEMVGLFVYAGVVIALIQGGVVRRLTPRFGERDVAISGLILMMPGLAVVGLSTTPFLLYVGLTFLAVGSALTMPTLTALASLLTPTDRQGEVLGVFRSLGALSRAIAPVIACAVYWRFGQEWPYLGGLPLFVVAVAVAFGISRITHRTPGSADAPSG